MVEIHREPIKEIIPDDLTFILNFGLDNYMKTIDYYLRPKTIVKNFLRSSLSDLEQLFKDKKMAEVNYKLYVYYI